MNIARKAFMEEKKQK
ncbi:BnaC04g22620D [Brassica napus]|uniref:BnaC04g22620D protein n=1 Tax=Brassica napus TaxID=3708 RepID=A0A078I7C3_BRANA|nr:BnaC04g22620D [Brassica napus]